MQILINAQTGESKVKLTKTEINQMTATMRLCKELRKQKMPDSINPFAASEELTKVLNHFAGDKQADAKPPEKPKPSSK